MASPFDESAFEERTASLGNALRALALEARERESGQELGSIEDFDFDESNTSRIFKGVIGGLASRKLGFNPFDLIPRQRKLLPKFDVEALRAERPDIENELANMDPLERALLIVDRPEDLAGVLASSEPLFERLFPDPAGGDPDLRRELTLERHRASGGRDLPRGSQSLKALEETSALAQIQDSTLRAQVESLVFGGERGVIPPDLAAARVLQSFDTAQAAVETAQLEPEKEQAAIESSRASAAASRASTAKTGIEAAQLARGPLVTFIDQATKRAFPAFLNSPEAQGFLARGFVPFEMGSLDVEAAGTAAAVGAPPKSEVEAAGKALRENTVITQRVTDALGALARNPRVVGPLADFARENLGLAAINLVSPKFADSLNVMLTGLDQEDFARLRSDFQILETQLVPPIIQEKRFTDSERQMVREIAAAGPATTEAALRGKFLAIRDLTVLNDDKLASIAQSPGPEFGELEVDGKLTPAADALLRKLRHRYGYSVEGASRMFRRIESQRRELRARGAQAGGSLDELLK